MTTALGKHQLHWQVINPDGSLDREGTIDLDLHAHGNGQTTAAVNDMLEVYFRTGTQKTTWYMGLVDNASFSGFSVSDTMSSHAGWQESSDYSETTRPTWTPGAAAGGAVVNSSTVNFSINATKSIKGFFVTSNSTKAGTTGILFTTAAFDQGVQSLVSGQTLKCTYTYTLTPAA